MNTTIKNLLDELEQVAETHRKSAEDLERRIAEIKKVAEERDYIFLNAIVEKQKHDRTEYRRYRNHCRVDEFEMYVWRRLYNETLIRAASSAEKEGT